MTWEVSLIAPVMDGIRYVRAADIEWGTTWVEFGECVGRRSWAGETVGIEGVITVPWTNIAGVRELGGES